MLAKINSYSITGLDACPVTIEVHVAGGFPGIHIVGLPDNAIRESKERVRSAIKNSGFLFPDGRITINLSPADTKKEGPSFDLAIALGLLAASGQMNPSVMDEYIILGELSLDGSIQSIRGALVIALSVPENRFKGLILPCGNAKEAALSDKVPIYPMKTLSELVLFLQGEESVRPFEVDRQSLWGKANRYAIDFSDVKGQLNVKRGLEIAAAGGHNVLMLGPPGGGKSMLAQRLLTILPEMTMEEGVETTKIYSVMGNRGCEKLISRRPFRAPHHTSSYVALVGGGAIPRAGEVTLAHNGILFLDELPEFNRNVLEALRQPLEDQQVNISRAAQSICFPSRFMLVCAMNPCPCGYYTDPQKECHCSSVQIQRYLAKISGPLLDRIDIHLDVPALRSKELLNYPPSESSDLIKQRTVRARQVQQERFREYGFFSNVQMGQKEIKKYCVLTEESKDLLRQAIEELGLSARAYDKILRVALTIADMEGEERIEPAFFAEAIQYRSLDRQWM